MAAGATIIRNPSTSSAGAQAEHRQFFGELESLRGLAALSVVAVHCIVAFAVVDQSAVGVRLFLDLANGRNAVVLFFVLSGFVLSESLAHNEHQARPMLVFVIKRMFRMLPLAYIGMVASAAFLFIFYDRANLSGYAAQWFRQGFYRPDANDLLANALFLDWRLNVAYWTLSVELLASLLFAPLFFLDRRLSLIGKAAVLLILMFPSWMFFHHLRLIYLFAEPVPLLCGYFFCFQLGIIVHRLRSSQTGLRVYNLDGAMVIVGLALLCLAHSAIADLLSIPRDAGEPTGGPLDYYEVLLEAFGSSMLIYGASGKSSRIARNFLGSSPVRYLGAISYGIYAIHLCILKPTFVFDVAHFGGSISRRPLLGPMFLLATVIPLSIVSAHMLRKFVELPGIELGRRAIKKLGLSRSVAKHFV